MRKQSKIPVVKSKKILLSLNPAEKMMMDELNDYLVQKRLEGWLIDLRKRRGEERFGDSNIVMALMRYAFENPELVDKVFLNLKESD